MKINLHQLLSADITDETAFHLVKFVRDLGLALESIYFDQMLRHGSICEQEPFQSESTERNDNPF